MNVKDEYDRCVREGLILPQSRVIQRFETVLKNTESGLKSIDILENSEGSYDNIIFDIYYNSLHQLTEAIISIDKIKILNHKCLFVYLCFKHPEFNLEFLESVRTKRNGINYYGEEMLELKAIEPILKKYIGRLKAEIEKIK